MRHGIAVMAVRHSAVRRGRSGPAVRLRHAVLWPRSRSAASAWVYNRALSRPDAFMLVLQSAPKRQPSGGRIGLAIAGGGPIGGMYELGALRALDEAIDGLDLTRLDVYVGVSSGAFLSASLANRMSTAELCRVLIEGDSQIAFRPESFVRPAFQEYIRRFASVPGILLRWWRDLLLNPTETGLTEALGRFASVVPTGLFDNAEIERYLRRVFTTGGRSNDFRTLHRKLYVVGVELDTGEAVRFGSAGWDDVPISRAVQASAALPGLYPPVPINGRYFVDGALRRTMHASVALEEGIDLLIGLNPMVPYDAARARSEGRPGAASLMDGGLPMVLSQTFRTLLQSRVQVGLAKYATQFRHVDQMVFEPNPDDAEMFFANAFSYANRQRVCEHAYRATLADLSRRRAQLAPVLARHGLGLRTGVLDDPDRSILDGLGIERPRSADVSARLRRALDDVDALVRARRPAPRG